MCTQSPGPLHCASHQCSRSRARLPRAEGTGRRPQCVSSVISVVRALVSPLALPASLPLFLYHLRGWTPLARSLPLEEPGTQPELRLSSAPGTYQRGGCLVLTTSRFLKVQAPPSAALPLSLEWSPQSSPTTWPPLPLTLLTEGARLASLPEHLVWWPQWGADI